MEHTDIYPCGKPMSRQTKAELLESLKAVNERMYGVHEVWKERYDKLEKAKKEEVERMRSMLTEAQDEAYNADTRANEIERGLGNLLRAMARNA